jgi:hypothetical protein
MEQFFVILAVVLFWVFRGVAGGQRRFPRGSPRDDAEQGPGGPIDVTGATRQRTAEGQQRALEALQRWEARQGLGAGASDRGSPDLTGAPSAARTRTARPAAFTRHTTAQRKRREAYAEIARMLDPGQAPGMPQRPRKRFEVDRAAAPIAAASVAEAASLEDPAELQATKNRRERAAAARKAASERSPAAAGPGRRARGRSAGVSGLARLEKLPLAARAVVFAEILGPPRSLT